MTHTLLIANRGEIAVRIASTARLMGIPTVGVYTPDDATSLHVDTCDTAVEIPSYLDSDAVLDAGVNNGATLVHPGYGFFAESADFARTVRDRGLTFVGPTPQALEAVGDKERTKSLANTLGISVTQSTGLLSGDAGVAQAVQLLEESPDGIAIKAVAGGGGRGIRVVTNDDDVAQALSQCAHEARVGFGDDRVFAEQWVQNARHVEVQALGASTGVHILGDRDCSLQRRRQKVIELAPALLAENVREELHDATRTLLEHVNYTSLATVEFLVTESGWYLMEVNPRIQVEHTVTECVTGLDLVELQLREAMGTGGEISPIPTKKVAVQARVCAERFTESGDVVPMTGTVEAFDAPHDAGVRVDTWIRSGTEIGTAYDSLVAKVICTGHDLDSALNNCERALARTQVRGVNTNVSFLQALLPYAVDATTSTIDTQFARIVESAPEALVEADEHSVPTDLADGEEAVLAPVSGTVVSLEPNEGELGLIEALKMHHPIVAPPHVNARPLVNVGDTVVKGQALWIVQGANGAHENATQATSQPHPGIQEVNDRHAVTHDEARPEAVAKRHGQNRRTARENLADLIVPGTFVEYGALAIAAQRKRRSLEELITKTPADGLVGGIGQVKTTSGPVSAVIMSYEYMVLAGTQGARNHAKTDRLLDLAHRKKLPVVFFVEGGGGRPGDTDIAPGTQLNVSTFAALARLRGVVPLIAVAAGRTFAGNAALAGVCDIIIAHEDANIGMGGPQMIAGGGLGTFDVSEVGPTAVHRRSGAVDIVVPDDQAAVKAVQKVLGLSQNVTEYEHTGEPQNTVPADRLRAFDMRDVITSVADDGTFLELRTDYASGAIVGFMRVHGHSFGFIANNNHHLGGAIDVDAARSFTQHIACVENLGLPLISFVDTPGFIVGPEAEKEPGMRAFGDLFVAGAHFTGSTGAVIIRKAYGLGAMAMTMGYLHATDFCIAWPAGEMGPMGLEGAVRLGYAKELAQVEGEEREQLYSRLLDELYAQGRALSAAEVFDIDDVIDPVHTREWIASLITPQ
ncbi:carboxyl transferase domain-containing protein [Brevibacterium sp. UMB1308A]|uniref:acetyl-CoA carboxylase family protein n=1 Tax=Brevibacterium sp. UMB1308A TaxID=3050608 RepID=UPI00254B2670|nr:carboxyl transferase domain-containing protein [Brevibacterium sp. UMB1308A]MDK8346133.1 carboxyl transferase domain-containing protein [Brevibacterium sp. UMB1308B]MDK8712433.1 carboxyl transferase domain-containing protein [Brevibacterium sp. UMB1308A]